VTERLSRQALALPIFHELADVDLDRIAGLIRSAVC
jgi:dTDP-4-amino-4,6-dideoxygalactose transaminase